MNVVYILRCRDGTLYTGWTNDLEKRLRTHAAGKGAKYTRARLPVTLVYTEVFETEHEARSRECGIKRLTRSQKLSLIKEKENAEHEKNGA
ncbi:MAG: GIY-YIG nuclease family protein [Oscillospiraceae bacterium]|nr:GIY-YIG nuclease family protein [Oscillospiraceae bacterium]